MKNIYHRITSAAVAIAAFPVGLYCLVAAPPLHWLGYNRPLPFAGDQSVYVPGSGFSGFWYHLGYLQGNMKQLESTESDYRYYCYSSGCLSLVLAQYSVQDVWDAAIDVQNEWLSGRLSRYNLVQHFVRPLLRYNAAFEKVHILVTDKTYGVRIERAKNLSNLTQLLVQTTHIPIATGPWPSLNTNFVVDGGFSRWLHPKCAHTVSVPITVQTTLHTLNPALDKTTAFSLYYQGMGDALYLTATQRNEATISNAFGR